MHGKRKKSEIVARPRSAQIACNTTGAHSANRVRAGRSVTAATRRGRRPHTIAHDAEGHWSVPACMRCDATILSRTHETKKAIDRAHAVLAHVSTISRSRPRAPPSGTRLAVSARAGVMRRGLVRVRRHSTDSLGPCGARDGPKRACAWPSRVSEWRGATGSVSRGCQCGASGASPIVLARLASLA